MDRRSTDGGGENSAASNDKYILSSLDGALTILNLFFDHEELNATEISKLLGMNRSSVFRTLVTLENRGYLTKDDTSRYRLGVKMLTLGQLAKSRMELPRLIHPFLEEITKESSETSQLVLLEGRSAVFVDKAVSPSALKMDTPLGSSYPAHQTGGGKAMLAFKDKAFIDTYIKKASFEPLTPHSMKDPAELLRVLERVRKNGWAEDAEEAEIGLTCYGVPILEENGDPICAISISGPTTRMKANKDSHVALLQEAAARISRKLR